jgi:biopolymer transport protein ExbD
MNPPPPPGTESFGWLWKTRRPPRRIAWGVITLAPLVDIVLLLFLFLLANSAFVLQPGIALQLPPSAFEDGTSYRELVVAVSPSGLYFYNDQRITLDRLAAILAEEAAADPSARLLIEADTRVTHGALVNLYTLAREAGVTQVVLATEPPSN